MLQEPEFVRRIRIAGGGELPHRCIGRLEFDQAEMLYADR
jgi:hypothetical protein